MARLFRSLVLILAVGVFGTSAAYAAPIDITVYTDHTGAQTDVDADNWYVWTFNVTNGTEIDEILGDFTIKRGSQTTEDISFALFEGDGTAWQDIGDVTSANFLEIFSWAAADVDTSYAPHLFPLDPDPNLTDPSKLYSLVLFTEATTSGAFQFFIKGAEGDLFVDPCVIVGGSVSCDPPVQPLDPVPEPSTIILTLSGVAVLAVRRWRRA
jgi:hypothetical protein